MVDKFFGITVTASSNDSGPVVGVVVGGQRMLSSVYATGKRLAAAGADGIDVNEINRSEVEILRNAGASIAKDQFGARYILDGELPKPASWLIKAETAAPSKRDNRFGPGVGRAKPPYSEPHPWNTGR